MDAQRLTPELAQKFARLVLQHVERECRNKPDHVLNDADDVRTPRSLHPVFYGSFDWHSCVHGYWLLARVGRLYPDAETAAAIAALFDRQLTDANVGGELAYLDRPMAGGFERPYGWAWTLMLQAELERQSTDRGRRWAAALRPLAAAFAALFAAYLPKLSYPVRAGTHANSAFALTLAWDYVETCGDKALQEMIPARALGWFGRDVDCQAWEPSGEDFLSPALMEAQLMRRVLAPTDFHRWLDRFAPRLIAGKPQSLFEPAIITDPSDGKIAHLDGLNLSRAWCWRVLAGALPSKDERRPAMLDAAERHLEVSLPAVAGDYMGEHWLASFALLALSA